MTPSLEPSHPPRHHPDVDLLLGHGTCPAHPALDLLVSTHSRMCPDCRSTVSDLDCIGATMFDDAGQLPLRAGARDALLAAVRAEPAPAGLEVTSSSSPGASSSEADGESAGPVDADYVLAVRENPSMATWHWRAPGVREARLPLAWDGIPVTIARLRSGVWIPRHTHKGREVTLVLSGSLRDENATYYAGDVADYDDSVSHEQFVDSREDCFCLVVTQTRLIPETLVGRIAALFLRS